MRLCMADVLSTANTGLLTSYDLGCMNSTVGNIHFMNKEEAGRRAALVMRVRRTVSRARMPRPVRPTKLPNHACRPCRR